MMKIKSSLNGRNVIGCRFECEAVTYKRDGGEIRVSRATGWNWMLRLEVKYEKVSVRIGACGDLEKLNFSKTKIIIFVIGQIITP